MKLKINLITRDDVLLAPVLDNDFNDSEEETNGHEIYKLKIGRHKTCPLKTTSNWTEEERIKLRESLSTEKRKFNHMQIATAVLIENEPTNEVLITKRPKHMRGFPNTYVVPGGSIEPIDETIYHAVIREALEETGIMLDKSSLKPMYCWESCFPTSIEFGTPLRHHLIIYFHAKVNLFEKNATKEERYKILNLQREEVESASWIDMSIAKKISENLEVMTDEKVYQDQFFETYHIDGNYSQSPLQVLFSTDSTIGKERLTTGTRFLISTWFSIHKDL